MGRAGEEPPRGRRQVIYDVSTRRLPRNSASPMPPCRPCSSPVVDRAAQALTATVPRLRQLPHRSRLSPRRPARAGWTPSARRRRAAIAWATPMRAVKLVEYGSRTCPHCAAFDAEGFPALKSGSIASGKLSHEFRDFPIHAELDIGPDPARPLRRAQPVLPDARADDDLAAAAAG